MLQEIEEDSPELDMTTQLPAPSNISAVTKDLFNLYSLSCHCKSKDISERRIRLDFGLVAEVLFLSTSMIIVVVVIMQINFS
jgi:hypothetical protein